MADELSDNSYAFTGQRLDPESNLYHFHFRKYDVEVGVWTTADPIGVLGGGNLYQYVDNNPINFIDILGLTTGGGNSAVGEADEFGSEGYGERQEGYGESFGDDSDVYPNHISDLYFGGSAKTPQPERLPIETEEEDSLIERLWNAYNSGWGQAVTYDAAGVGLIVGGLLTWETGLGLTLVSTGIGFLAEGGVRTSAQLMGGDLGSIPSGPGIVIDIADGVHSTYTECEENKK